jgi:hypothetical protein
LADVEPAVSEDCAAKTGPAISVVATSAMAKFLNIASSCLFGGGDFRDRAVFEQTFTPCALNLF